jgi:hypothetical protein
MKSKESATRINFSSFSGTFETCDGAERCSRHYPMISYYHKGRLHNEKSTARVWFSNKETFILYRKVYDEDEWKKIILRKGKRK